MRGLRDNLIDTLDARCVSDNVINALRDSEACKDVKPASHTPTRHLDGVSNVAQDELLPGEFAVSNIQHS